MVTCSIKYGLTDSSSWRKSPTLEPLRKEPMRSCAPSSRWFCSAAGGKSGSGFLFLSNTPSPLRMICATKPPEFAREMRRFCTMGGFGRVAVARSRARFAASTYLERLTCEISRASLFLSKPWAEPSAGSKPCSAMPGISKRSRIVFSYSVRVSLRIPVRPAPASFACSVFRSDSFKDFV